MHRRRLVAALLAVGALVGPVAVGLCLAAGPAAAAISPGTAPIARESAPSGGTRVFLKVVPGPTGTPTSTPTRVPSHPPTNPPPHGGGGGLPKTGSDAQILFPLGLGALTLGGLLFWAFGRRRRRRTG